MSATRHALVAVAVAVLLVGCGGSVSDQGAAAFVAKVKASVPETRAYSDEQLRSMAENICTLGSVDKAVQVLDNFSAVPTADRAAVAAIGLETAC